MVRGVCTREEGSGRGVGEGNMGFFLGRMFLHVCVWGGGGARRLLTSVGVDR